MARASAPPGASSSVMAISPALGLRSVPASWFRRTRGLVDVAAGAEATGELGVDVGERDVARGEADQDVEQQVGRLVDDLVGGGRGVRELGGELAVLLGDLLEDLRHPLVEQRFRVALLRR